MEAYPQDRGCKRAMATTMAVAPSASSTLSGADQSLPPLHQAIPEFYSHLPGEMHSSGSWSSMPRRIADRGSPSSRSTRRISQSPSSAVSETSTSMPVLSSPQWRRASAAPACPVPNVPLTGGRAVATSSDSEARYDAPSYTLPPSAVDQRRISIISSSAPSSFGTENRQSPYLPPVKSLASSRGSSFEIDSSERPQAPLTLPSLFTNSQSHAQPSQRGAYSNSPIDTEMRYQPSPQDQHPRYTGGPSTPTAASSYRAPSPGHPYTPPHYFHSSHDRSPRIEGGANFGSGQSMVVDSRSPFSTGSHPIDMAMDHFDHGRPGKRRRGNLPKHVTDLLRGWLNDHLHHPYPTEDEKQMLMQQTGLNINQVSNWFINARRRRLPSITSTSRVEPDQKLPHTMGGMSHGR